MYRRELGFHGDRRFGGKTKNQTNGLDIKNHGNCISKITKESLALYKKQAFVYAGAAKISLQGQFT